MKIITRKEAKEQGLKHYFTGKPCKHGHVSERSCSNSSCASCRTGWDRSSVFLATRSLFDQHLSESGLREMLLNERMRRSSDPELAAIRFIRGSLHRVERGPLTKLTSSSEDAVGYTRDELVNHVESNFKNGMSWENRSEWHIDHIKPLSLFLKEGITDPAIINALSNLQPLWAKDNLSKGAKYNRRSSEAS